MHCTAPEEAWTGSRSVEACNQAGNHRIIRIKMMPSRRARRKEGGNERATSLPPSGRPPRDAIIFLWEIRWLRAASLPAPPATAPSSLREQIHDPSPSLS